MHEHAQCPGGAAHQRGGAEGQRVADAAAYPLIDQDEVGEHPPPQVIPGQDLAQRGPAVILRCGPAGGADIHSAGRSGQVAVLACPAVCRGISQLRAAAAARKMRQVAGLPRLLGRCRCSRPTPHSGRPALSMACSSTLPVTDSIWRPRNR